jgi:hypothetical protein
MSLGKGFILAGTIFSLIVAATVGLYEVKTDTGFAEVFIVSMLVVMVIYLAEAYYSR